MQFDLVHSRHLDPVPIVISKLDAVINAAIANPCPCNLASELNHQSFKDSKNF